MEARAWDEGVSKYINEPVARRRGGTGEGESEAAGPALTGWPQFGSWKVLEDLPTQIPYLP